LQDVHAYPDVIESECNFDDGGHIRAEKSGFGCFLSLRVVQIVFSDIKSGGLELCGQHPDFMPHVENGLLGRGGRGSQLPVVTLIPEPQWTLKTGQEPGFRLHRFHITRKSL
jgi:hypothetical protein